MFKRKVFRCPTEGHVHGEYFKKIIDGYALTTLFWSAEFLGEMAHF